MKSDNEPKNNLPIIIAIFAIFFLVLTLFAGFASAPKIDLPSTPANAINNATDNISDTTVTRSGKPVFPESNAEQKNIIEE